ncbi:hypothetical protein [Azospirillum halopraeferens]|uniref:hypothetical protein n=1 Tax=Azospirillum halopraeferens TaxID=34010 RepID=UPI0004126405|nr:hypothetical protein [Azospirillum halopraeferens]
MLHRSQVEARIRQKLADDPTFRARLYADPRATLEAEFKLVLSPRVSIALHEDTAEALHIVLPPEGDPPATALPRRPAASSGCDRHPQFRMA